MATLAAPDTAFRWRLPWPTGVSTNHLYLRTANGVRLSPAAQAWKDHVIVIVRQAIGDAGRPLKLPEGPLGFRLRYWPPKDGRKHDPSNLLKLTEDAVFAAFFADDERLFKTEAIRQDRSAEPCLVVAVYPLDRGES